MTTDLVIEEARKKFRLFVEKLESETNDAIFKTIWEQHMAMNMDKEMSEGDNLFISISKFKENADGIKYFPELDETALHIAKKYNIQMIKTNPTPSDAIKKHSGYYTMIQKTLKQTQFYMNKMKQLAFKYYRLKHGTTTTAEKFDWSKV